MKKIYILSLLIIITALAFADIMYDSGIAGKTGSPGESDCTGCHTSFAVNSGPGAISISSPNLTNWEYVQGQVYQIDVTVSQLTMPLFGFGFEALRTSNNSNGGILSITNSAQTQLKFVNVSGSNRTNVVHKFNGGLTSDSHTFSFNWTAPATNIGNVIFYAAGNASDNQGDSLGDYVYKTTQLVIPFTTGISEINSNEGLEVFPNPVHDIVNIKLPSSMQSGNFQLFDSNGKIVFSEFKSKISSSKITLQLPDDISAGVYFLKASDDNSHFYNTKVFICK